MTIAAEVSVYEANRNRRPALGVRGDVDVPIEQAFAAGKVKRCHLVAGGLQPVSERQQIALSVNDGGAGLDGLVVRAEVELGGVHGDTTGGERGDGALDELDARVEGAEMLE